VKTTVPPSVPQANNAAALPANQKPNSVIVVKPAVVAKPKAKPVPTVKPAATPPAGKPANTKAVTKPPPKQPVPAKKPPAPPKTNVTEQSQNNDY
jgi:hypothetical protein